MFMEICYKTTQISAMHIPHANIRAQMLLAFENAARGMVDQYEHEMRTG